jgi:hypothetical protein
MQSIGRPRRSEPRRRRLAASGLTTMMLALGLGLTAPAGAQVSGTVVLYEDINYGGASRGFAAGSYSNIGSDWNDRASSIRVPSGTVVSVYVDGGFGGRCENLRSDDSDLRNNPIGNDTITALKVGQACPPRLYDDPNYGGSYQQFFTSIPDLAAYGFSNRAESMTLQPGTFVSLYDQPNYTGLCEQFDADDTNFANDPIRQRASSLRINVACPPQGVIFDGASYDGDYYMVPFKSSSFLGHPDNTPAAWSDRASSVSVAGGAVLELRRGNFLADATGLTGGVALTCERFKVPDPDLSNNVIGTDQANGASSYVGLTTLNLVDGCGLYLN